MIWKTILGGVFTSLSLVCVNYGIANGIAGIAFSIGNSFPAWHAMVNWLFLSQAISSGQIVGVFLALGGSVILSTHDHITNCFCGDKDKSNSVKDGDGEDRGTFEPIEYKEANDVQ